jgi:hypothetical protein
LTAVAVATAAWLALRDDRGRALRKKAGRRATRLLGRGRGIAYRFAGGHPVLDVDDATLADRVRSSLGPLEKQLDVPRVHVMVEEHIVLLHGEVASAGDADQIEMAGHRRRPARRPAAVLDERRPGLTAASILVESGRARHLAVVRGVARCR